MVYGIGTDICDLRRIRASLERHGERFAQRILSPAELAVWPTRFSAKESFSKAIGLGMVMPMTWRSCEITNLSSGKPEVVLHGALKIWFEARSLSAQVSVTDETDYAVSFVVVEQSNDPTPQKEHP